MTRRGPRTALWLACLLPIAASNFGCGSASDNEAVFAGGGGKPDPNVPQSSAEYDQKYQDKPAAPARKPR